jgi:c-di-GMP-binding flagellar brake protein YcgR
VTDERRAAPRSACAGAAELQLSFELPPLRARIENVSIEGCLLVLEDSLTLETESIAELTFDVNRLSFRVKGVVKSTCSETVYGFHFPDLSERVRLRLEDLIEELGFNVVTTPEDE